MKDFSIAKLKELIYEYDEARSTLDEMQVRWNEHDDPTADPGLQFEQETKVENALKDIKRYVQVMPDVDVFGDLRRMGLSSDQCMEVSNYVENLFRK